MPDENTIRRIVQEELRAQDGRGAFSTFGVPKHIHNGFDAPYVYAPIQVYAGLIQADITDPLLQQILPAGWTVTNPSTGLYAIHHNLGSDAYVTVASGIQSTNEVVIPIISQFPNEVDITWFDDTATFQEVQTGFNFVLVAVANKATIPPKFNYRNVLQ